MEKGFTTAGFRSSCDAVTRQLTFADPFADMTSDRVCLIVTITISTVFAAVVVDSGKSSFST